MAQFLAKHKIRFIAFIVVDLLLAAFLVNLYLVRTEMNRVEDLLRLGATEYEQPFELGSFNLVDNRDQAFGRDNLDGRWSLVFFGYTSCPDVCPLTMFELAKFYRELEVMADVELPQVIIASVDPATDSPAVLTEYLSRFHEDFIGLTGDLDALAELAGQLFVARTESPQSEAATATGTHTGHSPVTAVEGNAYTIEHSGHISVINPAGELIAVLRLPHRSDNLLQAYQQLIAD